MTDTPLPSELVEKWRSRAEFMEYLEGEERADELRQCARELQASLEAMQKEGGE